MRTRGRVSALMIITRGDDEHSVEVEVSGLYIPGRPGCRYLRNGDPGYPEESPEIDDLSATTKDGAMIELTEDEEEKAINLLIDRQEES